MYFWLHLRVLPHAYSSTQNLNSAESVKLPETLNLNRSTAVRWCLLAIPVEPLFLGASCLKRNGTGSMEHCNTMMVASSSDGFVAGLDCSPVAQQYPSINKSSFNCGNYRVRLTMIQGMFLKHWVWGSPGADLTALRTILYRRSELEAPIGTSHLHTEAAAGREKLGRSRL